MSPPLEQLEADLNELEARIRAVERQQNESTTLDAQTLEAPARDFQIVRDRGQRASEQLTIQQAVMDTITHFESASGKAAPIDDLREELREQEYEPSDIRDVLDDLHENGLIYEPTVGCVRVVR